MNYHSASSVSAIGAQIASEPLPTSPVEDRISMLGLKAGSIAGKVDYLADRLGLILSAAPPVGVGKAESLPPCACALEDRLLDVDRILRDVLESLETLTRRVAL